jgi:energy-coupling factor transporter ATP-binding protein EcfA2
MVGYVMDDPFDQLTRATYTVYEEIAFGLQNIGVPAEEIHSNVQQVLEELNITELAERVPTTLSGGEQQRVAIASIFARRPDILIMDEATSQLDPQGTESIFQLVRHFREAGKTILMVEPKLDKILQHADRLIFLDKGKIIANGATQDVLNEGMFERIEMGLPSYPALAKTLEAAGLYQGRLPVKLEEAQGMVEEVLHGDH